MIIFLFYSFYLFVDSFSAKEIRMAKNDFVYAGTLLLLFLAVIIRGQFRESTLELLLALSRPGATVVLLGSVLFLFTKGFVYTGIVAVIAAVFLLRDLWTRWPRSDARRLHLDIGRDQARFDERTSVDLQWASGSATHDSPNMLHRDRDTSPLLLYPPSESTLVSMCG
jgi:hypothetical protein